MLLKRPLSFVSKKEASHYPFIGKAVKLLECKFLDRNDLKQQIKVILDVKKSLNEKQRDWCNYPEGRRNKNPYSAIVGLLNNDPYEIFVGANEEDLFDEQTKEYIGRRIIFSKSLLGKSSTLTRVSRGVYLFKCGDFQYSIVRKNENEANSIITLVSRIMSTALRHGADIKYIVDQCDKTEGSFLSAAKIFSRTLKKYIKDKSSSEELCPNCKNVLVKKEGCKTCPNCGWSACG